MKFYTVDAFTSSAFSGNPAAVVPLYQKLNDMQMQDIAMEMNLSETAYVCPIDDADGKSFENEHQFNLRWFTPTAEIFFCGHATLATAHVLFSVIGNNCDLLEFKTLAGSLKVKKEGSSLLLDFPVHEPINATHSQMPGFMQLAKAAAGGTEIKEVLIEPKNKYLLVCLQDMKREDFERLQPNGLNELKNEHVLGVIITTKVSGDTDSEDYDFVSRFFAPWLGVAEDPVTGSAHTVLTPYWSKRLHKLQMKCKQMSKRGGSMLVRLNDDRVEILANAITTISGVIHNIH